MYRVECTVKQRHRKTHSTCFSKHYLCPVLNPKFSDIKCIYILKLACTVVDLFPSFMLSPGASSPADQLISCSRWWRIVVLCGLHILLLEADTPPEHHVLAAKNDDGHHWMRSQCKEIYIQHTANSDSYKYSCSRVNVYPLMTHSGNFLGMFLKDGTQRQKIELIFLCAAVLKVSSAAFMAVT